MLSDYSGYITDMVGLEITNPAFTANISRVLVNNVEIASERYSIDTTANTITLDRDNFISVGTYEITIEASGFDDAYSEVALEIAGWDMLVLYDIDDLKSVEPVLIQDDIDDRLEEVKSQMQIDLMDRLNSIQQWGKSKYGESFNVLDRIKNPIKIKYLAIYKALSIVFNSRRFDNSGDGLIDRKYEQYHKDYTRQLQTIPQLIWFDLDYSEVYGRVRFTR